MIVGNGGPLKREDVLAKNEGLCRVLAKTPRSKQGALDFVNKFGLLTAGSSQSLLSFYALISRAKYLVKMDDARPKNYNGLEEWMILNGKEIYLHAELQDPEEGGPPQLFFAPRTLYDAIVLQFYQDVSRGTQLRSCKLPGCTNWVSFGPGTKRRETGNFCSPNHARAYRYQMKKQETKGEEKQ
jgi:hypothetical protein